MSFSDRKPNELVPLSPEAMDALEEEWLKGAITAPLRPEASTNWCCPGECCMRAMDAKEEVQG